MSPTQEAAFSIDLACESKLTGTVVYRAEDVI